MDKKEAVERAIDSLKLSGFHFAKADKKLFNDYKNNKITSADVYRSINDNLPKNANRLKIAITECGHNPDITNKFIPKIGQKIKCHTCKKETTVIDLIV